MFGSRMICGVRCTVKPVRIGIRCQSNSSSSAAKLLQEKTQKIDIHKSRLQTEKQKQAHGKGSQHNNVKNSGKNGNNNNNDNNNGNQSKMIIKKGFSNVNKVPSTINLETRDVLLDKLYQGYNPLLSPIKPKVKKTSPKILVNIYEDLAYDEDEDTFGSSNDAIDSMVGPKLQISKYIYDKNPAMEAKLKELDSTDDNDGKDAKLSNDKTPDLFETRENNSSRRGRVRLHYKKNMKKVDESED